MAMKKASDKSKHSPKCASDPMKDTCTPANAVEWIKHQSELDAKLMQEKLDRTRNPFERRRMIEEIHQHQLIAKTVRSISPSALNDFVKALNSLTDLEAIEIRTAIVLAGTYETAQDFCELFIGVTHDIQNAYWSILDHVERGERDRNVPREERNAVDR